MEKKARDNSVVDCLLMAIGFIGAICNGLSLTVLTILLSLVFNEIGEDHSSPDFTRNMNRNACRFLYLGAASFVSAFLEGCCCTMAAERLASRLRARYLEAVMRQDVAFFDTEITTAEAFNLISHGSHVIQDVLGDKAPNFLMECSTFVGNYIVACILLWQLALAAFPSLLLLIIPGLISGRLLLNLTRKIQHEQNKASAIASQSLSAIRTVYSFTAELRIVSAFSSALDRSAHLGLRQDIVKGLAVGSNNVIFAIFAFILWRGARLVQHHDAKGGTIIGVGLCIVNGGQALGAGLSNLKFLVEGISCYEKMLEVIQRRPLIDSNGNKGEIIERVEGELELKEVAFFYPSRPSVGVLKEGFNMRVEAGKSVALVGESGSGKSTVISLLQRFYDPSVGEILLDGVNVKKLRLNWLREQMGMVSQEPVLFACSIKANILFGKEDGTMEEVVKAAKTANADEFISKLPLGYDTLVGEGGIQLSGGEKQRVAIARAIIRSPKILLLDEATSALDTKSELLVQQALDRAIIGRTTIIIAHRLSTIRNSNTIFVIQNGRIIESGSHNHLISLTNGHYSYLTRLQQSQQFVNSTTISPLSHTTQNINQYQRHNSLSSRVMSFDGDKKMKNNNAPPSFWSLLLMNKPEWRHVLLGCACAVLVGLPNLIYMYSISSTLAVYLDKNKSDIATKTRAYCLLLLAISAFGFLVHVLKEYSFSIMGHYLTKRIRECMLSKMLSFEVGWFDEEENSTGANCSIISKHAFAIQSLVGDRLSLVIQTISTVLIANVIGLATAWKIAIVIISVQPILITCHYIKLCLLKELSRKGISGQTYSNKLAMEAIQNIRTIAAFSSQNHILRLFLRAQIAPRRQAIRYSRFAGAILGFFLAISYCSWALPFYYGGILLSKGSITTKAFLQTQMILFKTSLIIANACAATADITRGISSASIILSIMERPAKINPESQEGQKAESLKGLIELRDVSFSYPSRPLAFVLKNFSLSFEAAKSTALVGPSGSGKSTIINLIERFYDPNNGDVFVDGRNIRTYHLRSLRRHFALVGQEPTLFIGTVKENILYGVEEATDAEIEAAARIANAHEFICGLEDGYDTICGERGVQLSGGQKQRVAIARAVLRSPSVLLLDEATSALDGEAERLVQEALERVMRGKTTVVVAHKLGTVRNCDLIAVIENGVLVEKGTHGSLMEMGDTGVYYGLVGLQVGQEKVI